MVPGHSPSGRDKALKQPPVRVRIPLARLGDGGYPRGPHCARPHSGVGLHLPPIAKFMAIQDVSVDKEQEYG